MPAVKLHRVVVLAAVLIVCCSSAELNDTQLIESLVKLEEKIQAIANETQRLYQDRCASLDNCTTNADCSAAACGESFPSSLGFQCNYDFGNESACPCDGQVRSLQNSVIRVPLDLGDAQGAAEFMCFSKRLHDNFTVSGLRSWQYVGHESGAIRIYPGAPQGRGGGSCDGYDPRRRQWYVGAISPPKDVVILYERSKWMRSTREETVCAMHKLLDAFTPNDYVSVVGYNEDVVDLGEGYLMRGTEDNLRQMKIDINGLTAEGEAYGIKNAVRRAFDIFTASKTAGRSSGCPTKTLMIISEGLTQVEETTQEIAEGQTRLGTDEARVFGISILSDSKGALDHNLQTLTCQNGGVWTRLGADPIASLTPYFNFLSLGMSASRTQWTAPYIDAWGLGLMVSVGAPFFDTARDPPVAVGVAATDILINDLELISANQTAVFEALAARGRVCPAFNVDECILQLLRERSGFVCPGQADVETCKLTRTLSAKSCAEAKHPDEVFCTPNNGKGDNSVACCSSEEQCLKSGLIPVTSPPAVPDLCPIAAGSRSSVLATVFVIIFVTVGLLVGH